MPSVIAPSPRQSCRAASVSASLAPVAGSRVVTRQRGIGSSTPTTASPTAISRPAHAGDGQLDAVGMGQGGALDRRDTHPRHRGHPQPFARGRQRRGYSPVSPSTDSRSRSAWPLWRAYSSIMWATIHRRLGARPSGQVRRASCSRPPSPSALGDQRAGPGHRVLPEREQRVGGTCAAERHSQSRSARQSTPSRGGRGSPECKTG